MPGIADTRSSMLRPWYARMRTPSTLRREGFPAKITFESNRFWIEVGNAGCGSAGRTASGFPGRRMTETRPGGAGDFGQDGHLRRDGRPRREEDRDPVRLVLDLQDAVAVLRRPHVRDDADDPNLARRPAGFRDLLGPREVMTGPQHVPQDLEPMPEVPREVREGPLARRMARDVPEDPHVRVLVCGLLPDAPERRGDERVRQARRGRRPRHYLGRGVPGDFIRVHHVIEGDDERRLRAGSEERLEALDGIALP